MEIQIFNQNIKLGGELKKYLEEKIKKLNRFSQKIIRAQVDLSYNANHPKSQVLRLEVNLYLPKKNLRAVARAADLQTAIDNVEKKLRKQFKKYKGFKEEKRRQTAKIIRKKKSYV
ncbi:ribosome-associated translation inhibitor RaiA [bacterium]|nr:ribosome-associated translation inhibitor RaiA [bacterium]